MVRLVMFVICFQLLSKDEPCGFMKLLLYKKCIFLENENKINI